MHRGFSVPQLSGRGRNSETSASADRLEIRERNLGELTVVAGRLYPQCSSGQRFVLRRALAPGQEACRALRRALAPYPADRDSEQCRGGPQDFKLARQLNRAACEQQPCRYARLSGTAGRTIEVHAAPCSLALHLSSDKARPHAAARHAAFAALYGARPSTSSKRRAPHGLFTHDPTSADLIRVRQTVAQVPSRVSALPLACRLDAWRPPASALLDVAARAAFFEYVNYHCKEPHWLRKI